jgi:hypothetical protein
LKSVVGFGAKEREYRLVHVIRDPLAALVSGLVYHRRHPTDEKWLSDAREEFHGLTYADFLKSLIPRDQIRAEIIVADEELRALLLGYVECERDARCLNVRLEDFETQFSHTLTRVLLHLRFPRERIFDMVRVASVADTAKWSDEERAGNVHLTRDSDERGNLFKAAFEDSDIATTIRNMRLVMNYTSSSKP